jgi:hypothetical protein
MLKTISDVLTIAKLGSGNPAYRMGATQGFDFEVQRRAAFGIE